MKYRLGFVTNSSSSSFIFGRPNENTITTEKAWQYIKDSATKLLSIIHYLDEEVYNIPVIRTNLKIFRNGNDSFKLEAKIRNQLDKLYSFKRKVKSQFKMCGITIEEDNADKPNSIYYSYFMGTYLDNEEIAWLKQIANSSSSYLDAIDFRNPSDENYYSDRISEALGWYIGDIPEEGTPYQLAYQYLGEVALLGDDPCLPPLLADFLYCKLKYASMHLG